MNLADSLDFAFALFQSVRVPWKVQIDQRCKLLQVDTFRGYIRNRYTVTGKPYVRSILTPRPVIRKPRYFHLPNLGTKVSNVLFTAISL
jgi:hypothetical protein